MQELLSKIIETDKKARKIKNAAEDYKLSSEQEIEELRQKIYDDYITRAKERVEKNIAIDRQRAEEQYAQRKSEAERLSDRMKESYNQRGEQWAEEIAQRVLRGS